MLFPKVNQQRKMSKVSKFAQHFVKLELMNMLSKLS